jgi:hypothetical protein
MTTGDLDTAAADAEGRVRKPKAKKPKKPEK